MNNVYWMMNNRQRINWGRKSGFMGNKFCTECGNRLGYNDSYCSECGRSTGGISFSGIHRLQGSYISSLDEREKCPRCDGTGRCRVIDNVPKPIIPLITVGLPLFSVPVVMRVYHTHSPCLEEGVA